MQNITNELRQIFIADAGKKIAYVDKDQAESRAVAYISGDKGYIEACLSGDLHTTVARMVWKDLPGQGTIRKTERWLIGHSIATSPTAIWRSAEVTEPTIMAVQDHGQAPKVTEELMKGFQDAYFTTFPGLREWHHRV